MNSKDYHIHTQRLLLHLFEKKDVLKQFPIIKDNHKLTQYMTWDAPSDIKESYENYESCKKEFPHKTIVWAITHNNEFIGRIGIHGLTYSIGVHEKNEGELGYWLDPAYHGKGFMTEATKAVIDFCFATLKLERITIGHFKENVASQKVIEKCGFKCIGIERKFAKLKSTGKWHDNVTYDLIRDD